MNGDSALIACIDAESHYSNLTDKETSLFFYECSVAEGFLFTKK